LPVLPARKKTLLAVNSLSGVHYLSLIWLTTMAGYPAKQWMPPPNMASALQRWGKKRLRDHRSDDSIAAFALSIFYRTLPEIQNDLLR
jgi:hypothetical protein